MLKHQLSSHCSETLMLMIAGALYRCEGLGENDPFYQEEMDFVNQVIGELAERQEGGN
jgi:hypothetical protein